MTSSDSFLKAFDLIKGSEWNGYILDGVTIISKHYYFDIKLTFKQFHINANTKLLFSSLDKNVLSVNHDIKGIKNYYNCTVDLLSYEVNGKVVVVNLIGNVIRN